MSWQSVTFDWNQARAFLATVEEGSLSGAARALGQTQPTVGRQVAALEVVLEITLFERIGRSLQLTEAGAELLDNVRAMRDAAARVAVTASGQSQTIEGRVRITASDIMAAYQLPQVVQQIRDAAPLLEIDIVATNDIRNLQRREADIAIRHVLPDQPELIAKRVATSSAHCYASTAYIARRGRPETPEDFSTHDFIAFGAPEEMLGHLTPLGFKLTRDNIRLGSESGVTSWQLACAGHGIALMSDDVGGATKDMVCLMPQSDLVSFPTWLATHRELHTSRRIRLVFDILAGFLSRPAHGRS